LVKLAVELTEYFLFRQVKRHRAVLATTANRIRCGDDFGNYGWTRDGTPIHLLWDYFNGEWVTKAELAALYRCDVGDVLSYHQFAKLDTADWVFDDADHLNAWSARERDLDWENAPYQAWRDLGPGAQPEPRLDFPPGDETKVKKSCKKGTDNEARDRAAHEANIQDDMAKIDHVMGREVTALHLPLPLPLAPAQAPTRTSTRTRTRTGKGQAIDEFEGDFATSRTRSAKGKGKQVATDIDDTQNAEDDAEEAVDHEEDAGDAVEDGVETGEAEEEVKSYASAIAEVVEMGFTAEEAMQALAGTQSGVDVGAAVQWLIDQHHADTGNAVEDADDDAENPEDDADEPEHAEEDTVEAAEEAVGVKKRKFETVLESIEEGDEAEEDLAPAAKRSRVGTPEIPALDPAAETVVEDEEVAKEEIGKKEEAVEEKEVAGKEKKKRGRKPASKPTAAPSTRVTRSMSRQRSEGLHGAAADGPADPPARRLTRSQRERSVTTKAAELQEGGKWSRSSLKKGAK
jgi:hypothetical protein